MNKSSIQMMKIIPLMVIVIGCGGEVPQKARTDGETAVEERLRERAIQAESQAMERPMEIQETAQAISISRAVPASASIPPVPTSTPTLPSSISLLSKARRAMAELQSYKFDMEVASKVEADGRTLESPITLSGHFQAPDRFHVTISGNLMGFVDLAVETIQIGDRRYEKVSGETEWTVLQNPGSFNSLLEGFLNVPIEIQPVLESVNGFSVYSLDWQVSGGREVNALLELVSGKDIEGTPETINLKAKIDVDSFYFRKLALSVESDIIVSEERGIGEGGVTVKIRFSGFDEVLAPIAPPKSITQAAAPNPTLALVPPMPAVTTTPLTGSVRSDLDEDRIVFAQLHDNDYDIYSIKADGSGQTNLTRSPGADVVPAWSPDGTRVAFASDRDGNTDIYVMKSDGSGVQKLTQDPATDILPAWSPEGTKLAFVSERHGNLEIYVMNSDGSGQKQRLTFNASVDLRPSWHPDGSRIAFYSDRDGNLEVYEMSTDGKNQVNLTNHPGDDAQPRWSPDGLKIVFSSNRENSKDIYVMNANGSDHVNLTTHSADDQVPAWSPDGSGIAFMSDRDGENQIFTMDFDGQRISRLTYGDRDARSPSWR